MVRTQAQALLAELQQQRAARTLADKPAPIERVSGAVDGGPALLVENLSGTLHSTGIEVQGGIGMIGRGDYGVVGQSPDGVGVMGFGATGLCGFSNDMGLSAQLQIREAGRPARIVVVRDTMTIGRDASNDIVLESITVSRFHAVLVRKAVGLLLVDLESVNGTLVNGVLVQPDEPLGLNDGDELQFGLVRARYVALYSAARQPHVLAPAPAS